MLKRVSIAGAPFIVKKIEMDYDLRTIWCSSEVVRNLAKEFKIGEGEAVAFCNKAFNRFRIVWKCGATLFVVAPEVAKENLNETFLHVGSMLTDWCSDANKNVVKLPTTRRSGISSLK